MQRNIIIALFGLSCVLAIATNRSSAGSIVENGGFETGDFTGWTLVGDPNNNFVDTGFPRSGIFNAAFGENGNLGSLSQMLTTNVCVPYTLIFWFAGGGDPSIEFTASIGGETLLDLVNPPADGIYHQYTYNFTATSTSTPLQFGFRDDSFFIYLDDVSVNPTATAVPEPHSLWLFGQATILSLISYGWLRQRGQRR